VATILDKQRYSCPLAGMRTVSAIQRSLPILHSSQGCAEKLFGGGGSSGYFSPHIFPCSALGESEVIFGGTDRLRETIEYAFKVVDADFYVVLSSCVSEIIGDDVVGVVASFEGSEKPLVYASTPGFGGTSYTGHEAVLKAIFSQYLEPAATVEKGLVNVWASVPYQDQYWAGDYEVLGSLLESIGLTPNIIFGYGSSLEKVQRIPAAQFNLLVSPWVGLSGVQLLEERFGTPFLHYPTLPVGAVETTRFLETIGSFAGVDPLKTKQVIDRNEERYYHYIERYADTFLETRVMAKYFTVISDAVQTLAFTRFFTNDLGLLPGKQYVIDETPEEYRDLVRAQFTDLNYGNAAEISFESDGHLIHEQIRAADYHGYPLLIGSSWEKPLADELFAHYLALASPSLERLVVDRSYVGYSGGLRLIEDIYSVVMTRFN
jgi:nitrogenase molybdenum-iron protein beta chain